MELQFYGCPLVLKCVDGLVFDKSPQITQSPYQAVGLSKVDGPPVTKMTLLLAAVILLANVLH